MLSLNEAVFCAVGREKRGERIELLMCKLALCVKLHSLQADTCIIQGVFARKHSCQLRFPQSKEGTTVIGTLYLHCPSTVFHVTTLAWVKLTLAAFQI